MPQYVRLQEGARTLRRTVADALEALREAAAFQDNSHAKIHIDPLWLSSGDNISLVHLFFESPHQEKIFIVSLPTSTRCRAICEGSSRHKYFEINLLDGAVVDAEANVRLLDGTNLRAVEVMPFRLFYEPTELDWRIVHYTVSIIGAEDRCYRSLREGLPPHYQRMVPDKQFLDCSRLSELDLPPLKVLASLIAEKDWTLRKLSPQKIANSLRQFGMRIPKPRPQVQ